MVTAVSELLTVGDIQRIFRLKSRQAVGKLRKAGLPFVRVGGAVRFRPEHVNAWLDSCTDNLPKSAA